MQYHRSIEERAAAPRRLIVENRAGELIVVGEERDDVLITAQITVDSDNDRSGRARLAEVRLPIAATKDAVVIGPPDLPKDEPPLVHVLRHLGITHGTQIAIRVSVPRNVAVRAVQRAGSLRVSGIHAPCDIEVFAGSAHVDDIGGHVRISTRLGSATLADIRGDVAVDSRAGRVQADRISGALQVTARRGSVIARTVGGALDVDARGGKVVLEDVAGATRVRTRAGSVEWRGKIQASMDIESRAGSLRIAVTPDSAFWVDAEARAGSVRSELPVDYLKKPDAKAPTVKIRAHAGTIRIVAV
ncbi:MAG: hypothetical protein EPO65_02975 [Dehalococcoidia bacterium]|nr:MAG: hypothetical protein EPO65_02975 [Dehalococcoidia bacterium]